MTKLYNLKNQLPIYVEQKNTQTNLQAKDILKTKNAAPQQICESRENW